MSNVVSAGTHRYNSTDPEALLNCYRERLNAIDLAGMAQDIEMMAQAEQDSFSNEEDWTVTHIMKERELIQRIFFYFDSIEIQSEQDELDMDDLFWYVEELRLE